VAIPTALRGTFIDDYGTRHTIDDSLWVHGSVNRYHLVEWHPGAHSVITRSGPADAAAGGGFGRIDWLTLAGTDGWEWAFCIVAWDVPSVAAARAVTVADTSHPRSGCGGYPFTRMRRSDTAPPPGAFDE